MDERDLVGIGESPPVKLAGRDDDFCVKERDFVRKGFTPRKKGDTYFLIKDVIVVREVRIDEIVFRR